VEVLKTLETRFGYVFKGVEPGKPVFRPWLVANDITPTQTFSVGTVTVRPFLQDHRFSSTIGYSFGDVVYSTDLVDLPQSSKDIIRGAKIWIVGALSDVPYPTHAHVGQVVAWAEELKPKRTIITHMSSALDYDSLIAKLPVGITPAFDGMVIET
jgi:phosphoribosyl 1,2-cyclic phosphate phosphodiesterase